MRATALAFVSVLALAGRATGGAASTRPLAIIVNPKNPIAGLTDADLRELFRADRQFWLPSVRVTLVLEASDAEAHQALCRRLLDLTPAELERIHLQKSYRGVLATRIVVVASPEAARSAVAANPNAIGYVWADLADNTVTPVRSLSPP